MTNNTHKLPPIHPGEILLHEFLEPLAIDASGLSKALSVQEQQVDSIVQKKHGITADMALRLSRYFGNSAQFWMNLQSRYELEITKDKLQNRLEKEVIARAA